jgi:hypothetical protein
MSYSDPDISGSRVRLRRSFEAGDSPADGELRPGEPAINAADGIMYVGTADGSASVLPKAVGFSSIQALSQGDYDALVAATATISTVLYVVTPDPE